MQKFYLVGKRGDTIPFRIDITRNGVAVNLTGATFKLGCKKWLTDVTPLIEVTDFTVDDVASGIVYIDIPPADTSSFTDSVDLHTDIEMTESNGKKTTVSSGILSVVLDTV